MFFFVFFSSPRPSEVIITLAVFGCLLLVLIVVLFLAMIRHKEPLGSQGYRQISREGADES